MVSGLETIIAQQLKLDFIHSLIAKHLQHMEELIFENDESIKNLKKKSFTHRKFPVNKCNVILCERQTRSDLAEYLRTACYDPVQSTFLKAVEKGFLKS